MKDYYPKIEKFEKLSVIFRIFETEDPDLIAKIAMSTNNQNRINPRDLRANGKEQVALELALKAKGIRYSRKRGVISNLESGERTLDALKAGQVLLSYVHLDPARAKRDSDSIFTDFYHKIFNSVDIDVLVEAVEWFDLIEERRNIIEDDIRIRGARRTENTFVTYGVFHILMMCGLMGGKADPGERPKIIDKAIDAIAKQIRNAGEPAFYAFFRDTRQAEVLREFAGQPLLI